MANKVTRLQNLHAFFRCACSLMFLVAVSTLITLVPVSTASASEILVNKGERLLLEVGEGTLMPEFQGVDALFVSDPEIADVKISPNNVAFLYGRTPGTTTLIATNASGDQLFSYSIIVIHAISGINEMLKQRFPEQQVSLNSFRGSIQLQGAVETKQIKAEIMKSLIAALPDIAILDQVVVDKPDLIRLDVKLVEVNKLTLEKQGVDWSGLVSHHGFSFGQQNGKINLGYNAEQSKRLELTLDLLVRNRHASIVTETSLLTVSGKEANFEVGGEIPIPTFTDKSESSNNYSLSYKFVGLNLVFSPRRIEEQKIALSILSSITSAMPSNVTINGNSFPTLNARRFNTDIELLDRQSFIIAGLSRAEVFSLAHNFSGSKQPNKLTRLFSPDETQSDKQDFIILVTPYFNHDLDRGVSGNYIPRTQSNIEHLIQKKLGKEVTIHGSGGFVY